jgi:uncharacterized hydrophobic protein (TIGR00271 family)
LNTPSQEAASDTAEQRDSICKAIRDNAAFTIPYVAMNALATVVAAYGLLQNSTAVVIGALVIAMLLGPISGMALALVSGDNGLFRKSLTAEVGGVAVVLGVSFIIGKIHQDMPITSEILARTGPNILDLMIALAGGAAGAYATVSPRLSVGLVGVAIATALVPPLATCSICLARGESRLASGGFLLVLSYLVAIQFSSSIVMFLHGYHKIGKNKVDNGLIVRRSIASLILLLVLATILGYDFSQTIGKQQFEAHTRKQLEQELKAYPGVQLADIRFYHEGNTEVVTAVLRTPYSFSPDRVAGLEAKLTAPKGETLQLHIRSVITKETTRAGYLHELPETPSMDEADKVGQ